MLLILYIAPVADAGFLPLGGGGGGVLIEIQCANFSRSCIH